jgi:hypothetical protein
MSTPTVASLIEGFPVPTIEPIIGRPTYKNITILARVLCQNAASILCKNGGRNHGYLGLLLSPTTYATLLVTPFTNSLNPGVSPIIPLALVPQAFEPSNATIKNHYISGKKRTLSTKPSKNKLSAPSKPFS